MESKAIYSLRFYKHCNSEVFANMLAMLFSSFFHLIGLYIISIMLCLGADAKVLKKEAGKAQAN